jgi:hypothetical protein
MVNAVLRGVLLAAALFTSANAQTVSAPPPPDATTSTAGVVERRSPAPQVTNWSTPLDYGTKAASPVTPGANKIVCSYGVIDVAVTINSLGLNVVTTDSAKRFQLAIYATGAWGRPGALVSSTTDITLGAGVGVLNGAVSSALARGGYWTCLNTESTIAVWTSRSAAGADVLSAAFLGSPTQANVGGNTTSATGISITQTYGTWPPAFTSGTVWTEVTTASVPWLTYQVSSSP